MVVDAKGVEEAFKRFHGRIHKTPIMSCESINKIAGCNVFLKCEHLQKTGSFKARGALNAVQKLKDTMQVNGVVTHSSGNHGQGLAWAAAQTCLPCRVAVPENAPPSKLEAMKEYGAVLELCESTVKSREQPRFVWIKEHMDFNITGFYSPNSDLTPGGSNARISSRGTRVPLKVFVPAMRRYLSSSSTATPKRPLKIQLHLLDGSAEWPHDPEHLNTNVEMFVARTRRRNRISCVYVRPVPNAYSHYSSRMGMLSISARCHHFTGD